MEERTIPIQVSNDELISDDVQEIINHRPHWVVRRGISIFFLLLLSFLGMSWLIKYPDTITGTIHLLTNNSPKQINAAVGGKLERLFVQNEQVVAKGQVLAYLNSTAQHEKVLELQSFLNKLIIMPAEKRINSINNFPVFFSELGELETNFQDFLLILKEVKQITSNGYYEKKKLALKADITSILLLQSNLLEYQNLLKQQYNLQKIELEVKQSLPKDKVITPIESNQDKVRLLMTEGSLNQIKTQLISSRISLESKQKESLDLQKLVFDKLQQFQSSLISLKSKVDEWVQDYVLIAPENGKVLFASPLQENEWLNLNQELFFVQPSSTAYYAELIAGQKGFGKISNGQKVIIKVESFPSPEFGFLSGKVEYITNIPNGRDSFLVKVQLPNGLKTSNGQTLNFRHRLVGTGEVITKERRLLQRFLGQLISSGSN